MKEKIFEKIISRRGILAFTSIFSLVLVSSLVILNYIPQDTSQTKGYFSSGNHTIESWISSYDSLSGSQLDTWLSIRLIIQYEDNPEEPPVNQKELIIDVFNHELANSDHRAIREITIPDINIISCKLEMEGYLDPDDPYLRAVHFSLDDRGGAIGTYRVGPHDVRGIGVISPGQRKSWVFDMSNCEFPLDWPETGGQYLNYIPQDTSQTKGYFSSGNHTIESWISSYDSLSGSQLDTWLSIRLIIQYEDTIEEKINPEEEEEEIDTEEKDEEDISCKIEKKRKKKYRPHNSDKYRRRKRMRCFHTFSTKNPYYFLN